MKKIEYNLRSGAYRAGVHGGARAPQSPRWEGGTGGHRHRGPAKCLTLKMYFIYINTSIKADFS